MKYLIALMVALFIAGCLKPAGEIEYTISQDELEQVRIEHIKMAEEARRNGQNISSPFEIERWQR